MAPLLNYGPFAALAIGLTWVTSLACRRGHDYLIRTLWALGTILWLVLSWVLHASVSIRQALAGTPFGEFVALLFDLFLPLACVALGAFCSPARARVANSLRSFLLVAITLSACLAAVPDLVDGQLPRAFVWLALAAVLVVALRRQAVRAGGTKLVEITAGTLKERWNAIAAKAGHPGTKVYLATSEKPLPANALAVPGHGVVMTAALLAALPRVEMDAILAHEISHFHRLPHSPWMVLGAAVIVTHTMTADLLGTVTSPLVVLFGLPLAFLWALHDTRKREFAADAGSAKLIGDGRPDGRPMMTALARLSQLHQRNPHVDVWVELLSTHPSTERRIQKLATASRVAAIEVETLLATPAIAPEPSECYDPPAAPDSNAIFNRAWQEKNAARYGWIIMLAVPLAAIAASLLTEQLPALGSARFLLGILVGCVFAKLLVVAGTAYHYGKFSRRLSTKLGATGFLAGLAPGDSPRIFGGHRYYDAGLVRFEADRFIYLSERTHIQLNPLDVIETRLVRAAPAAWIARQPMLRFRDPATGQTRAFILHPLSGIAGDRLYRELEQWRTRGENAAPTNIQGFDAAAGEVYQPAPFGATLRGFQMSGTLTLLGAIVTGWPLRQEAPSGIYALAVAFAGYAMLMLPVVFYRPGSAQFPRTET
ncbi:MAG TPA: M48 family metalloprotease [Bryobacteraceae bacterium]|nr:M48 family metalloprotease [Bryobacteraceae bacterium]